MATRDLVLSCKSKAKILKWHVKPGESVKKDKLLATYISTEKVDQSNFIVQRKLKSKFDGEVLELLVNPNDEVKKGYLYFYIYYDKSTELIALKE